MKKETYIFVFQFKNPSWTIEVFAPDMMDAQRKVEKIMGINGEIPAPVFVTQNWDCPRCRNVEHECNYQG